jgi:hypothetical protein
MTWIPNVPHVVMTRPRRSPQPYDCIIFSVTVLYQKENGDHDQKEYATESLEVLQPGTAHPKLAQAVAIATGGWETPHEFGLAHSLLAGGFRLSEDAARRRRCKRINAADR